MKSINKASLFFFIFCFQLTFSQIKTEKTKGFLYKASIASTLTVNKEYTLDKDDDSGPLINPSALFVNNTIGYQFDNRTTIGLNLEYNYHSQQGLHFAPAYLSLRHNLIADDDNFFIRGGYGSLLGVSKDFKKGNMYKVGIGSQIFDNNYRNSFLIGVDFTRKRFGYKTLEGLSSVSVFVEFVLF